MVVIEKLRVMGDLLKRVARSGSDESEGENAEDLETVEQNNLNDDMQREETPEYYSIASILSRFIYLFFSRSPGTRTHAGRGWWGCNDVTSRGKIISKSTRVVPGSLQSLPSSPGPASYLA